MSPIIGIIASNYTFVDPTKFLIGGERGTGAWTSTDGITWNARQSQQWKATNGYALGYWSGVISNVLYVTEVSNDGGFLYSTTNGTAWSVVRWNSTYNDASSFAYANSRWFFPMERTLWQTTDGVSFTASTAFPSGVSLRKPVHDGGSLYMVPASTRPWTSTDAVTWTSRTIIASSTSCLCVAYGTDEALWVGVSNDNTLEPPQYYIHSSTNGVSWSQRVVTSDVLGSSIVYGASRFLLSTSQNSLAYSSDNATTWNTRTLPVAGTRFDYVGFANNYYFAFSLVDNKICYSTNTVTWTSRTISAAGGGITFRSISYFSSKYYLFGDYDTTDQTPVYSSTDLVTWDVVSDSNSNLGKYYAATVNGGVRVGNKFTFVGVGSNVVDTTDFTTWNVRTITNSISIDGIGYGNGVYVLVGNNGQIRTSTDGITWTSRTSNTTTDLRSVAYGNSVYVTGGVASGVLRSSTDAVTWTTRTSGFSGAIERVRFLNGQFITVGGSGRLGNSTDGVTWTTRQPNGSSTVIYDAAYGAGVYLIAREGNVLATSTDLTTWTTRNSALGSGGNAILNNAAYNAGIFVVFKVYGSGISPETFTTYQTSTDGITWTSRTISGWITGGTGGYFSVNGSIEAL